MKNVKIELTPEESWLIDQVRQAAPFSTLHLYRQNGRVKRLVVEDSVLFVGEIGDTATHSILARDA